MGIKTLIVLIPLLMGSYAEAQSLKGSKASMDKQNQERQEHNYTRVYSKVGVKKMVQQGHFKPLGKNKNYSLSGVSHPYARSEVKLFVERFSSQHKSSCGKKLVVTSATRTHNPSNGSKRSVHPAGMAVDLRITKSKACRAFIESTLLFLEKKGVVEATREKYKPHYHVAVFPEYASYVARLSKAGAAQKTGKAYTVKSGDSLWKIARAYGTTVNKLKSYNQLKSDKVKPGQKIKIPS